MTEYGIADLRGQTDATVIERILNITDSRFQPGLIEQAQRPESCPRNSALIHASQKTPRNASRTRHRAIRRCLLNTHWDAILQVKSAT